jgi:hypothetical protein
VLVLCGGAVAFGSIRHGPRAPPPERPPLTEEEEARLREITRG